MGFSWFYLPVVLLALTITSNSLHLLRGTYAFNLRKPWYRLWMRFYYQLEWVLMKMLFKLGSGRFLQRHRFLRAFFQKTIGVYGDGEIYTLQECFQILDSIYAHYPNAYVGLRTCACRQGRNAFDDEYPKVTDLTFVYSKTPGKRKSFRDGIFISLERGKQLLRDLDASGAVHTMFGGCAKWVDGSVSVSICNCRRGICVPLTLALDYDAFELYPPHNKAIIDPQKCRGQNDCGKCLDVCQFDARIVDPQSGKIQVLENKCYGCGLCATHCPEGATQIRFLHGKKVGFYQNLFQNR